MIFQKRSNKPSLESLQYKIRLVVVACHPQSRARQLLLPSCSQVPVRGQLPRRLGATWLLSKIGYLHPIWPDRLLLFRWAHWSGPRGAGGGPRALLSDGVLRGSSVQRGIALVEQSCGLVHHRQLRLLRQVLRADGAPIQGKLRAGLHP